VPVAVTDAKPGLPIADSPRHADGDIYGDNESDKYADVNSDGNIYPNGVADLWPGLHNVVDHGNVDRSD
jgi:hypothetical protein